MLAHCDSLDGPGVQAAQRSLETRNLSPVLIWVKADDEREIRAAFEQTLLVRALSRSPCSPGVLTKVFAAGPKTS